MGGGEGGRHMNSRGLCCANAPPHTHTPTHPHTHTHPDPSSTIHPIAHTETTLAPTKTARWGNNQSSPPNPPATQCDTVGVP